MKAKLADDIKTSGRLALYWEVERHPVKDGFDFICKVGVIFFSTNVSSFSLVLTQRTPHAVVLQNATEEGRVLGV